MSNNKIDESASHEGSPLLAATAGDAASRRGSDDDSPAPSAALVHRGRLLLFLVAFLYGSLSVSLRLVYARPGPPSASVLSATRGWMTVACLLPLILVSSFRGTNSAPNTATGGAPPTKEDQSSGCPVSDNNGRRYSRISFYGFCWELAIFNFGTQGLLNIGLLTTESARSSFFTQLSVVITPILAAAIGACRRGNKNNKTTIRLKVWIACGLALAGLVLLSLADSSSSSSATTTTNDGSSIDNNHYNGILLSFGDWCCLGSAFCWSYYIYRLSDWGDRYDEAQTMFAKNVFMAILYTAWTGASYAWTIHNNNKGSSEINNNENHQIIEQQQDDGFVLWEGWKDPIALAILFYTALSSGALADVLQQSAQAHVRAAESNVILSLEPVFAAVLGLLLLHEIPSPQECLGGALIVVASYLAST